MAGGHRAGQRAVGQPQLRGSHLARCVAELPGGSAAVIAYALAGTMDADLEHDALGTRPDGTPVLLADIWASDEEIAALVAQHVDRSLYEEGTRGL